MTLPMEGTKLMLGRTTQISILVSDKLPSPQRVAAQKENPELTVRKSYATVSFREEEKNAS